MKIDGNYSNIYFGAKNKKTREADDIARLAKRTFPILSSTHIRMYNSGNNTSAYKGILINKLAGQISKSREVSSYTQIQYPYSNKLTAINNFKVGNCYEMAISVIAGLVSNGLYNSKQGSLSVNSEVINKRTGKVEYEITDRIDHSAAITTIDGTNSFDEKNILIIDPWIGFCGNIAKAREEYKKVFDEECKKNEAKARAAFALKQSIKYDKIINVDDYDVRSKFFFNYYENYTEEEMKIMEKGLIQDYKGLVKKPQNNQATGGQCVQDTSSVQT